MHISDGILSGPVLAAGFAGTAVLAGLTMRKMDMEDIPKVAVITAVFFVASLIRIPAGISIHLTLNGLVGVVLGWRAFPAIMLGIILQAILFGHGGVSVIGVNSLMLGGGGLLAFGIWQLRHLVNFPKKEVVFGAIAGGVGIFSSGLILAAALVTTGKEFTAIATGIVGVHVVLMVVEGLVVGAAAGFLVKVKPEVLAGYKRPVPTPAPPTDPPPATGGGGGAKVGMIAVLALSAALFAPSSAEAHKLLIDYTPTRQGLFVEVFFPDGKPAKGVDVRLMTPMGELVEQAKTDPQGGYLFRLSTAADYVADGDDGMGHFAEVEIAASVFSGIQLDATGDAGAVASKIEKEPLPASKIILGVLVIAGLAGAAFMARKKSR